MTDKRNVTITLEKAREWYESGIPALKAIALQAFTKLELESFPFERIKTLEDACRVVDEDYVEVLHTANELAKTSKSLGALYKLRIIRKALNYGMSQYPSVGTIWLPVVRLSTDAPCEGRKIGTIELGVSSYNVYYHEAHSSILTKGYAGYNSMTNHYLCDIEYPLFGCESQEIANHFSKYFGMMLITAKLGDLPNFKIVTMIPQYAKK